MPITSSAKKALRVSKRKRVSHAQYGMNRAAVGGNRNTSMRGIGHIVYIDQGAMWQNAAGRDSVQGLGKISKKEFEYYENL